MWDIRKKGVKYDSDFQLEKTQGYNGETGVELALRESRGHFGTGSCEASVRCA